ncbi:MAG TPA: multiheme c-type cytochrome [Vicinamibacteria bacterium]
MTTLPRTDDGGSGATRGRELEWGRRFAALTLAWLAAESLTGLGLWLLPFSVPAQWMVVVHTVVGLAFLVPVLVYLGQHFLAYRTRPQGAVVWMGYAGTAAALAAIVSGVVLTVQAAWASRISYAWDQVHLVSTFALLAFALPHVVVVAVRDGAAAVRLGLFALRSAEARTLRGAAAMGVLLLAPVALLWALAPGERMADAFPADYSYALGPERPFAPSLATTATGGAYDSRRLSGSESCGTTGCHEQITAEWRVSAHRWAAMDPAFQRIQQEMAKQNGPESTRYCGGCHDPISLFSGTKNIFAENLTGLAGYQEGVSCLACHSIRQTDVKGNASFVVAPPSRYLFEGSEGRGARFARDFIIRAYPWEHTASLSKRLFKTPEYCAACHKQFIDQEVNKVGWVQLQNQFDNWRKSHWNHPGEARRTIECRECHMPLQDSRDPARGDALDYNRTAEDGRHRSHRFLGANQAIPTMLKLPGGEEQSRLVEEWLQGRYEIPEIEDKWAKGPVVGLEIEMPEEAAAGETVSVRAVITANKVGHDFPTGPLDIIQAWVEIVARDASGRVVFASGRRDERHFIEPGTFMFKAEPVDQYGNLIDRHNLWEMVGVRYRRSLFPGFSDTAEYAIRCSGSASSGSPGLREERFALPAPAAAGEMTVTARLLYRKVDQYLLNFMFGEKSGLTSPVTEMARAEARMRVVPRRAAAALPVPVAVRTAALR